MVRPTFVAFCTLVISCSCHPLSKTQSVNKSPYTFPFVSREDWGGRPPTDDLTRIGFPVDLVVIHHTYQPRICLTREECKHAMRWMQNLHQITNGWMDIGYNFAVGGEGSVYEGRGWDAVGAHAVGVNSKSVGIAMIGDFVSNLPPIKQKRAVDSLIATGVKLGYISPDYRLIGHRQVSSTECPGQALFDTISKWDHFYSNF